MIRMRFHPQKRGRLSFAYRDCSIPFLILCFISSIASAQMKPGDVRRSYGEPRASIMESLLQTLYPGSVVQWDTYFMVKLPGENFRNLALPVYVWPSPTGRLQGVATIEFDQQKDRFIYEAQNFRRSDAPNFSTDLIVFRADAAGHIRTYKKMPLDPEEPLTEIKVLSLKDWSHTEWPTLEIQYQTHRPTSSSFTTIEWSSVFDANSGQFISRLPMGISRTNHGGAEQMFMFGIGRTSPSTVTIANRLGGDTRQYACSDPCVMEADTLLAKWNLDAPIAPAAAKSSATQNANGAPLAASNQSSASLNSGPVTIRLKNGRTIHADSAIENGEKMEYVIGESTFKIPRSMVDEITHSSAPSASLAGSKASSGPQNSSGTQTSTSDCPKHSDSYIPCRQVFFMQVLMGLGETQRFRLIDDGNHDVTAQANWVISDVADQVDFSVVDGMPRVYSKSFGLGTEGLVNLYATVGDNTAMARIYILKPEDIASTKGGRWGTPNFPNGPHPLTMVPAAPFIGRVQ